MSSYNEVLDLNPSSEEKNGLDAALRPSSLREFVGQASLKENLHVFLTAAKKRGEALDHTLFYSPPGLGKTTLANILAKEMGVNIKTTSGPVLSRPGDLAAMLTTEISEGDILFVDEIHRLNPAVEEALYPAMEDFNFFINTGKGAGSTTLKLSVPKFTLVGATTRSGLLTGPLRDRFGIVFNLNFYEITEIADILERSAKLLNIEADRRGLEALAARSRGTPRIANRLLRRARDFAQVKGDGVITCDIADIAMQSLDIDAEGLDTMDKRILEALIEKFGGGPVGVENLAIAVSESIDTLTDVIEPYLIKAGFIARTPRGRVATKKAYDHLGRKSPEGMLF
ncbi:Holliday junction resolvasome, helicase subunit [Elusimicrobium minutum Pei191]|uniref:Holliday junction branch migration complex subunit RuvB n=1 Tax=Elusimicrobium minutum (strain Pei191) TaxID=445932 RepID=B2KCE0_ELUMP|nr:Holliday junction branch migration DNA helicase RuvB [Elusimicrobium minutum]ACC98061.1 Holliday junction resolvasome, helicase subunit [Elusimicrobium minutum Pei191]